MIDDKQYVKDATRTESTKEEIILNPTLLAATLEIFIAAGTMLDFIKKNAFYDREYDSEKFKVSFTQIASALMELQPVIAQMEQDEIKMMPDRNVGVVDVNPRIFHSIIGTATEATEMVEALVKSFSAPNMDDINLLEEVGDVMWYFAILLDEMDGDLDTIMTTNIAKLKARFPEKFTNDNANTRDLETEKEILKKNVE